MQVRVRNHAKMVDCYLTTFNNHMSMFGDKKSVAKSIVDHPEKYRDELYKNRSSRKTDSQ